MTRSQREVRAKTAGGGRGEKGAALPHLSNNIQATSVSEAWWHEEVARVLPEATVCLTETAWDADLGSSIADTIAGIVEKVSPELKRERLYDSRKEGAALLFRSRDVVLLAEGATGSLELAVWSRNRRGAERVLTKVLRATPRAKPVDREEVVPFAFWQTAGEEGVRYHLKNIVCPSFAEIAPNYAPEVREQVARLLTFDRPDDMGKIVLWFGPPGTGKTHAVRALAREWVRRIGATAEVVLDPEVMLGSAAKMYSVLLNENHSEALADVLHSRAGYGRPRRPGRDEERMALRLIILEDAAELFSSGCRNTQGFARFLNLTDGIVGQGLRCVFLLTANEEIGRIDEALTRPGRCLQAVEFKPFDLADARAWLERNGADPRHAAGSPTLAELFALRSGSHHSAASTTPIGFAPRRERAS